MRKRFEQSTPTRLIDIGIELGLSPATVSRALNGFPEVGEATRSRVVDAAARLNYRPNQTARKLVGGRSDTVAMVLEQPRSLSADTTFFHVIGGISAALAEAGLDLVLHVSSDDDPVAPYRRLLARGMLDGFIVNAPRDEDTRIAFLAAERVPFVVHGRDVAEPSYAFFDIDNALASELAVELLCDLGHTRFALLNGPQGAAFAVERHSGFVRTIHRRIGDAASAIVLNGPLSESFGYASTLKVLGGTLGKPPTAVVCSSTAVAQGAYRAVIDRGLRVGQDVSIVSHDDEIPDLPAVAFVPPLTVTHSPLTDACRPLAELLVAAIRNGGLPVPGRVSVPELIVRSSTGPA